MAINWSLGQIDPNIATNALTAMRAGRQDRRQQDRENALRAYAQGGDVNALMAVDPEAGMQFQQAERETKRALATEDRTTQDRHRAQAVQFWQAVGSQPPETRAAYAAQLAGQMDPTERDRIMTVLPQADLSDQGISGYIQFSGGEAPKMQGVQLGNGGFGEYDPRARRLNVLREPDPIYQQLGAGESLISIPRGGQGGAPAAGAPPTGSVSAPRGTRNNNPGNIEDGPFAKSLPGYKGSDGRFAIFETPQAGQAAQGALLQSYGQRGLNTVQAIIGRWAPPSDGNPTDNYAKFVASKLGVSPSQPLDMNNPQVLQALSGAIAEFENGGQSASPALAGGPRVVAQGAPKPAGHMATPQERAALGFAGESPVWIGADGKPDVLGPGGATPRDRVTLRKEFEQNPDVKAFNDVAASYDIISRIGRGAPTAANDLSMIFSYMKMLDPGSVVREGEFANAQNSAGIPDQIRNAYNKALNGQRLNPNQREQFIATAGTIYNSRKARYDQQVAQYQGYASELGLPDSTIQPRIAAGGAPTRKSNVPPAARTAYDARVKAGKVDVSKPRGDAANPFLAVDMATANRLPKGSHVILPDGSLGVVE